MIETKVEDNQAEEHLKDLEHGDEERDKRGDSDAEPKRFRHKEVITVHKGMYK